MRIGIARVLKVIRSFHLANGYYPTRREIQKETGGSLDTIQNKIKKLELENKLTLKKGKIIECTLKVEGTVEFKKANKNYLDYYIHKGDIIEVTRGRLPARNDLVLLTVKNNKGETIEVISKLIENTFENKHSNNVVHSEFALKNVYGVITYLKRPMPERDRKPRGIF